MALWTKTEAVAATGGICAVDWVADGVSIDTRTLQAGDLFVALKDVRDGHDFVAAALAKGAAAALVSYVPEGVAADASLLVVPDVLVALERLGVAARARTRARVVGVTGSVGKTSTKEMLRTILGGQGKVHAAEASYNNHWGVPLTLARIPADADFVVIEIGMNHPKEIAPLARMARLDVAMVTTVAPAHLEAFDSVEEIAHEKASIMDGLVAGGVAVLNADVTTTPILRAKAKTLGAKVVMFGASADADWQVESVTIDNQATVVQAMRYGEPLLFKVLSPGRHFVVNALGALAVAEAMGCDVKIAACDIGRWLPPTGRGNRERIVVDVLEDLGFDLIDDAFNANPASMAAALDLLIGAMPETVVGCVSKGRRIAVLGDMLELGPTEVALHADIARHPGLEAVDMIHCVGLRMKTLWRALPRRQRGEWVEVAADLLPRVRSLIDPGDVILVKGSKGTKVSAVVDALRKLGQSGQTKPATKHMRTE